MPRFDIGKCIRPNQETQRSPPLLQHSLNRQNRIAARKLFFDSRHPEPRLPLARQFHHMNAVVERSESPLAFMRRPRCRDKHHPLNREPPQNLARHFYVGIMNRIESAAKKHGKHAVYSVRSIFTELSLTSLFGRS